MLKLWALTIGLLFSVGCFQESGAATPYSPVCTRSDYIERRGSAQNNLLRVIASLRALRSDGRSPDATLEAVRQSVLTETNTTACSDASRSFYEAWSEVFRAFYKACYGSGSIALDDFRGLASKYEKAFASRDIRKIREIFGHLACLKYKSPPIVERLPKREVYSNILEFFDCIDGGDLLFIFIQAGSADYSVAFVIDDTGSMSEEIDAVKCLVRSFVKSAGTSGPKKYILGTFNDPGRSKWLNSKS